MAKKKTKKLENIIEELPPVNDVTYDISMEEISHKMLQDEVPPSDYIELVCTRESIVVAKGFPNKRTNLLFSSEKKATILNKQMLTDESINIVQNILKNRFPKIAGLQDTVIGKTKVFDIIRNEERYIQIPQAGSFHWICVANHSYCQIYDSLTNESVPLDVAKQIAAFSYCESAKIVAEDFPVQQQRNCFDCVLFAIAFATSLAHNENSVRRVYDATKLRQHLVSCLEAGKMLVFPSHSTNKKIFQSNT